MLFKIGPTILVFGMQEIVQLGQKSKLSKLAKIYTWLQSFNQI